MTLKNSHQLWKVIKTTDCIKTTLMTTLKPYAVRLLMGKKALAKTYLYQQWKMENC